MIINLVIFIISITINIDTLEKGIRKYNKGKYQKAIEILGKIEKKNRNFEYYFYVGHSYSYLDNNKISIIYYDSAIQINNKKDIVFFEKGFSNFIIGNSIEALKNLNRAIQLKPNNAKYYVNRGTIKYDLGDKESACNDWYNAMRIDNTIINYKMIQSNCN
ncbi:MAG: hypothetical protein CL870_05145 [Cytophagia bacterium]|nr:hypothetical protein [Cytophagia bacterium]